MKKKLLSFLLLLLLVCSFAFPAYADVLPRVVDDAGLLTESEESALEEKIADIAKEYNFDVVIVTTDSLGGKTAEAFADDYFDYNGYGYGGEYDGILFAVSMGEREWAISTCGYGLVAFTDYSTDLMGENIVSHLSNGDYYDACLMFVEMSEDALLQAAYGAPYDTNNLNPTYDPNAGGEGSLFSPLFLLPALLIGFVISLLIALGFKAQLKTAVPEKYAGSYVRKGSFNLRHSNDIYLFSRTTRTRIESSSSSRGGGTTSHRSSSGRSHGGSSGRF